MQLGVILIIIGTVLMIFKVLFNFTKKEMILTERKAKSFAILIPARDESRVIENLLISIKKQVENLNSTYVIVETSDDPTCEIVKRCGGNIIIRKNLNLRRKGYALDEAIKEIKESYDLYFIFDADNVLDKNFIKEMINTYNKGYDIGIGYRNIKNSENIITTCSGLTFSMINTIFNKLRMKNNQTITISGTGYYISNNLIKRWKGFPFHSLTEDYELSLYASANNIKTFYNDAAIFYDEQPTSMKISIKQRTRWVKGFLESRKKRLKDVTTDFSKILGITPYLFLIIGILILIVSSAINLYFNLLIGILLSVYLILVIFTFIIIIKEKNNLNLSLKLKIKAILFNPIFLCTYIECLIRALTTNVSWDKIEHKKRH